MKTAISLPDELFQKAERLAKNTRKSRSEVYREALAEYVARHDGEAVTESWDNVLAEDQSDPFVEAAARRTLEQSEW